MGTRILHIKKKILPGAVTGNLIFKNNKVDLKCENPKITMGPRVHFTFGLGAQKLK